MEEIKLSIIIPVYNVSACLQRCLDSCLNQTLDNIEILVVNDCSPDPKDAVIMRDYETKYPNLIKCFWHSENKKQGGARNTAIQAALGKYVYFVDSDDYIDRDLCKKMYNALITTQSDMAVCDCIRIHKDSITKYYRQNGNFS